MTIELGRRCFRTGLLVAAATWLLAASEANAGTDSTAAYQTGEEYVSGLITERCMFCHSSSGVMRRLQASLASRGYAGTDSFLSTHSIPDEAARKALLDYLQNRYDPPPGLPQLDP